MTVCHKKLVTIYSITVLTRALFRPFLQQKEAAIDQVVDQVEDVADKLDDFVEDIHNKDD